MSRQAISQGTERLVLASAALASLALVASIAAVDYLPTHDGPHHIFFGFLQNHFDEAERGYARFLQRGRPVTSIGFDFLYSSIEALLPWRSALTVALSAMTLCWSWGFVALVAALRRERLALGLLGFATAFCWPFYMGLMSYYLATGFGFWVLALALRNEGSWSWRQRVGIGALLTAQALMHLFAAQATGLVLVALVLARGPAARRLRELVLLAVMAAPTLAIAAFAAGSVTLGQRLQADTWLSPGERLLTLAKMFVAGPAWRAWPLYGFVLVGLLLLVRSVRGSSPADARQAPRDRALGVAATLLLAAALLLPLHIAGWEFLSPRFVPTGAMLAAALLPLERWAQRWRRRVWALSALTAAVSIGWAAGFHQRLEARTSEALSGLDAPLQRSGPRLSVVLDPSAGLPSHQAWKTADVPYYKPLFNIGELYAVAQGGVPSWIFSSRPELHPFVFSPAGRRAYPPVHDAVAILESEILDDAGARASLLSFLAAAGSRFEDVILYGDVDDGDSLLARGYEADFRNGRLLLAHFVGCPALVRVAASKPIGHPFVVRCGYDPQQPPSATYELPAELAPTNGVIEALAPRCLCGPAWYQAFVDRDRSGELSTGDVLCAGADGRGRWHGTARRPGVAIPCQLPPAL